MPAVEFVAPFLGLPMIRPRSSHGVALRFAQTIASSVRAGQKFHARVLQFWNKARIKATHFPPIGVSFSRCIERKRREEVSEISHLDGGR